MNQMDCPKCNGKLKSSSKQADESRYSWCEYCKGIWINKKMLLKIFKSKPFIQDMVKTPLSQNHSVKFKCPTCRQQLDSGRVGDSELEIEECIKCAAYFFDDKELNKLFDIIKHDQLPKALPFKLDENILHPTNIDCPHCVGEKLIALEKDKHKVMTCFKCQGIMTDVSVLQMLAERSLFHPTMFSFREGQDAFAVCRHCSQQQDPKHIDCIKCGKTMGKTSCYSCSGKMSEYHSGEVVIERCHMCSSIWLDRGEFEKVMTVLPDLKYNFEKQNLRGQINTAMMSAKLETYVQSLEVSRRVMLRGFLGNWSFIFY